MTGGGAPEVRPCPLAPAGGLAADLLAGRERAREVVGRALLEGRSAVGGRDDGAGSSARLSASAFLPLSKRAERSLEAALGGEGVAVTTGQQPVFLLGPLYVLYKALSAAELARRLEAETGVPAVAVFWVASEDHDWEEVGRARLLDEENVLRTLRLSPPPGWAGRPVGPAPLGEGATGAPLAELEKLLPNSEFTPDYLNLIRDAYRPGRSVAEAFVHTLAGLLEGRDLAVLDAAHPEVKRASVPLLERALRETTAFSRALEEGAKRLRGAGYAPAIPVLEDASHVFFDTGEARERVRVSGDEARPGPEGDPGPLETLVGLLHREPDRFGPNVALRPVLESWLLPVAASVLGPGEIDYWAQLPELFREAGVTPPAVRPRHSWLLVEEKVAKVLRKLEVDPEAFASGPEEVARRVVREGRPAEVEEALARLRAAIGGGMEEVEKAVAARLPGLRSAVGKARSRAFQAVDELEGQVDARLRERDRVVLEQVEKAAVHLFPERAPQERVLCPLYHLSRYGPALLAAVEEATRAASPPLWPAPARVAGAREDG